VTVTGVDDATADGDKPYDIVFTATDAPSDTAYNGLMPGSIAVTNLDNDIAGITVSASTLSPTEAAGASHQATFTIKLNTQPILTGMATVNVNFHLSPNAAGEGTISPSLVTFDSGNYATPQTVTVTAVDNHDIGGNPTYFVVFDSTTGGDAAYNAITPSQISVTNVDDDSAGLTISPLTCNTSTGMPAAFSVTLTTAVTGQVTVLLSTSDANLGTVSDASVVFSTGTDWSTPHPFTVFPGTAGGMYTVTAAPDPGTAATVDPNYRTAPAALLSCTNTP
jgi:hypothetical protein